MIHTASIFDKEKPKGRLIAVTKQRPKNWPHECKPIFGPSWNLLKSYQGGYITQEKFKERYLTEMRHLYRSTTILKTFAQECIEQDVVLCCYCKQGTFCHRDILKQILEKIIENLNKYNIDKFKFYEV